MARWNLVIADDVDRHVRSYLARTGGKKGDLSRFVGRAVRQAIFWETVESIWERNRHLSNEAVQLLAEEAVAQARAECPASPEGGEILAQDDTVRSERINLRLSETAKRRGPKRQA